MFFDEINHQKRQNRESHHADLHDRTRTSHISITEDGSTAENEDVAESDVENTPSRLISHHDNASKRFIGVTGSSEIPKEVRRFTDSSVADLNRQKKFDGSLENEFKLGNLTYGAPFSVQPANMMNISYSLPVKESNSVSNCAPSSQGHPIPGMMQVMPNATTGAQPVKAGNLPLMFGYLPVQLPMLDKDASCGLVSHPHPHPPQFHPSYAGRGPPTSVSMQVIQNDSSDATQYNGRPLERTKGDGKQRSAEEGSSGQAEDVKGSGKNPKAKDLSDRSTTGGFSLDLSVIKPGIAADVKFGGCGSYPNLPWVSTTGSGPNGRTISGVTYRYNTNQIRIVCACHGSHMSPEEFVRHASEEHANPDGGTGLGPVSSSNPAASPHN
ncbi:Ninja-like protein [Quillaja saponaria]|uniref:Ninja-family protein n=1 Tax=Quillaja saponaria TaxID=32244 RepID=A0AAD7M6B8_QUISA|nr:Ninja-like protein [Quillaja saponaria]